MTPGLCLYFLLGTQPHSTSLRLQISSSTSYRVVWALPCALHTLTSKWSDGRVNLSEGPLSFRAFMCHQLNWYKNWILKSVQMDG